MPEQPGASPGRGSPGAVRHRSDLGRRVAARREELGLTREDVAARAGSAPGYLQYLEERSAAPGIGFLLRLADALETTVAELIGGTADLPPGVGEAARCPAFTALSEAECRAFLSTHGVGRVAATLEGEPAVFPVNYMVDGDLVAFRTAPGSVTATVAGRTAAFEVDHIDCAFSEGWSVLITGEARAVTAGDQVERLERAAHTTPWAGGDRNLWIVITPHRITGRRILVPGGHAGRDRTGDGHAGDGRTGRAP
ncbi:pyridoxamine 5'-phosphate oxidase family protein [Streptomyces sp. NPDC093085]|uniref:helix-turn-helix domain-containing protein n=1 Tax=Streptomyces sp. NPDC093085 TaxID=3155068 RepID=UPI00341F765D